MLLLILIRLGVDGMRVFISFIAGMLTGIFHENLKIGFDLLASRDVV